MVFEEAFARDLMNGPPGVAVPAVTWLVTGRWPAQGLSVDVSYPRGDYSGLLRF
ncbi:hypothetical protein OEM_p101220 (plasmid) [Mycobacterium intracellulare subsp. yongonense 05-1390]|nr:hypothetical protein OEM_p101220 [Mycobacterium intracellulare subsp. yongonense 05-1390]